jgi:hypothetical protein
VKGANEAPRSVRSWSRNGRPTGRTVVRIKEGRRGYLEL